MSYALVTVAGQQRLYANVTRAWVSNGYIHLRLTEHPGFVHFYIGTKEYSAQAKVKVLLAATAADLTEMLKDRQ